MYPFSVRRVPTVGCVTEPGHKAASIFNRKRLLMAAAAFGGLMAASEAGATDICSSYNTGGTLNGPNRPMFCTVTQPVRVVELATYHWNNGRGAPPGTIRLRDNNGRIFGPFQATASPGQGGAPNVNWSAKVDFILPPGTYHVIDSDNATWSWNGQTGGRGFAAIRGAPAYNPLPQGPGCIRYTNGVGDTSTCTGNVLAGPIPITMRLKKDLPGPLDPYAYFYVPNNPSVAVVRSNLSGSGTTINSQYTFSAGAPLCVNTGVVYSIRVSVRGQVQGDVGVFRPTCAAPAPQPQPPQPQPPPQPPQPQPAPTPPPQPAPAPNPRPSVAPIIRPGLPIRPGFPVAGAYNPLPQGPGCRRMAGAIADTSPCMGPVRRQNMLITMRLKRAIPARIDPVVTFYVPGRPSVAVVRSVVTSGSGTAVNSDYTFNAGPAMCVNTGVTYAIRVTVGGVSYGDVGGFTPDCR